MRALKFDSTWEIGVTQFQLVDLSFLEVYQLKNYPKDFKCNLFETFPVCISTFPAGGGRWVAGPNGNKANLSLSLS